MGAEVGGHSWRTAGDLGFELNRVFEVALKNAEHRAYNRPGSWNDPDYIQIGYIGSARVQGQPKPCPLAATEQYAFMSLWCLMASPLFFSGDMGKLDEFTVNVLCNPEVIEIDQDPLGPVRAGGASVRRHVPDGQGLGGSQQGRGPVQSGTSAQTITAKWSDLGVAGKQVVSRSLAAERPGHVREPVPGESRLPRCPARPRAT